MASMKNWVKVFLSVLFILFLTFCSYINSNKADIYAKIGKHYAQKGNYTKAINYYGQSYLIGNKDHSFRECYVNLLINSPLTIDAQEKLAEIAEDKINDTASESAKYFLFNLKREINNKYKDNYIQQAAFNQKIVHWGKMPITYSIKQPKDVPTEIIEAVNDAFDALERASSARIRFERTALNANIVVNFTNNEVQNAEYDKKYVIAYTVPVINQNKLIRMEMTLNTMNLDGKPYTPDQIYNTAIHEIFHALGFLGHSSDKNNIMYMTEAKNIDDKRKTISDADKTTLQLFYKIKPDITNGNELHYDYIPYPVIGNNSEVNYAKADEAKTYIRKAPTIPAGYIDLAQTQINDKKYDLAIINLEKALRLSDNDETKFLALYNLAVANYYDENYELALFYLKKASDIKDDEDLHLLSAEIFLKQKNEKQAIKEYEILISKNPNNIEYTINLTNIYIRKKQYIKARKILKEFIKRNPQEKNNPRFAPCKLLLL